MVNNKGLLILISLIY